MWGVFIGDDSLWIRKRGAETWSAKMNRMFYGDCVVSNADPSSLYLASYRRIKGPRMYVQASCCCYIPTL